MSDINIKRLISPFSLVASNPLQKKQATRPLCRCDSDDDQEMAPECAFVCNRFKDTTKKRRSRSRVKATRRRTQMKK